MAELKRDSVRALEEIVGQMNKARAEGNKFFKAQLFDEACRWYTKCICIGVEKLQEIEENFSLYSWSMETYEAGVYEIRKSLNLAKSNRSQVYLQQGNYESALADAEHYLENFDANNAKALNLKGQALEGLQQFEKAYRSFESARKLNPTDIGIQKSARRTWLCFRQSQEGEAYDPSDYYLNLGIRNNCLDPFCEYVGPVEIKLLPGRGRGLVLTRVALAGKALLASKALVMASDLINSLSDLAARSKMCRRKLSWLHAKPYDSEESDPNHVSFISGSCKSARVNTEQVRKWRTHSTTGDSVVRCYDEIDVPDMTVSVDSSLDTNTPRKDAEDEMLRTVQDGTSTSGSSNSESYKMGVPPMDLFRPCNLSAHRELTDNDDDEGEEPVQKLDIQSIAQLNGFGEYDNLSFELRAADHPELRNRDMEGLWLLPSFLNHSCIPNCGVVIFGEDMIVRATQDIAAGEELTITYFDPFIPYKRRLNLCSEWPMNFLCKCSRCRLEEIIAEPLETLNVAYQKYMDTKILDAETDAGFDHRIQVRFLSAAGMTCAAFVRNLDAVMSNISDLDEIQRSWIRASYLDVYCGQAAELPMNSNARIDSLKQVVEASMAVECSDTIGLRYYAILVREVDNYHGNGSNDFAEVERNFVEVLRVAYGVEKKSSALQLIEKLQSISSISF